MDLDFSILRRERKLPRLGLIVVSISLLSFQAMAQQGVVAAGGDAVSPGGSISYSIGQIVDVAQFSATITLTPGLQHGFEVQIINEVEKEIGTISVYPNPTSQTIKLKLTDDWQGIGFCLSDVEGRVITQAEAKNAVTEISLNELPDAIYFLSIMRTNTIIKTIKVIKTR